MIRSLPKQSFCKCHDQNFNNFSCKINCFYHLIVVNVGIQILEAQCGHFSRFNSKGLMIVLISCNISGVFFVDIGVEKITCLFQTSDKTRYMDIVSSGS